MLNKHNFYIVFYTIENNMNNLEHAAGFDEPPTLVMTKLLLDEFVDSSNDYAVTINGVQMVKPVYMAQMDSNQFTQCFLGNHETK